MTQPNLLELAQQGDSDAIAALMNLALEPKGVTAKTFLDEHCLHVFLSAARVLNAKTLVAFIQRGILRLEVASIQQVQVYGQRLGTDQPDWVETFVLPRSPVADALEALSHSPTTASKLNAVPLTSTYSGEWTQRWAGQKQSLQATLNKAFKASKRAASKRLASNPLRSSSTQRHDRDDAAQTVAETTGKKRAPATYVKLSVLVTLVAFVTGGTAALLANSYTIGSGNRTQTNTATIASSSQSIKADTERDQQQATAQKYLETMNKAQQSFYRQHNRFAATLEELERFAVVPIASRSDYLYKLTVPNSQQAQLTAVPKGKGLKSYTAVVSIAPTKQVMTAICASQHAAKVPPLVFQSTSGAVQCPV